MADTYDIIIVGGGAAGCVLANRLSARSSTSVLLLEAGVDTPPGAEPVDVLSVAPLSYYNSAYKWSFPGHMRTRETSPPVRLQQGRILGGGSSVMGMIALRGTDADYDEWERLGAAGWAWKDVLPFFRKLEHDADFDNEMHGRDGPTHIRRHREDEWPPLSRAAADYAGNRQIPFVADMNGDFRDGHCAVPMASTPEKRQSSAICYLDAAVRARPNLRVETGTTVTRLLLDGKRVTGVEATIGGQPRTLCAGEVILSAGAVFSPAMLMRAGIGPAEHLRALGIDVAADLPGVGGNLQNHPVLYFCAFLKPGAEQPASLLSHVNTCLRFSSRVPECPPTDMYNAIWSKTAWHALGHRLATLTTVVLKPASRGRITLSPANTQAEPLVEQNFLSDERDMARLIVGVRQLADFAGSPEVAPLARRFFPVFLNDRLRKLNQPTTANALKAWAVAKLIDVAPFMADRVSAMIGGKASLPEIAEDRERLAAHITANVGGTSHYVGTCRMGPASDRDAVVDPQGRVHGIAGLRVVDASVMPTIPRGNTNIPTIMVAEKMAAGMVG